LEGKKAIVTGGASGLSYGIVEAFHEAGVEVAIIDVADNVKDIAKDLEKGGARVFGIQANLGKRDELKNAFNEALNKLGDLDILVNGAGIQRRNKCEDFTEGDWDSVLEINLTSVFLMCQLAGRVMLKKNKGKIINFASMLSFFGGYTVPAYAASKGGVAQLTKALSNEWSGKGVNVNAIAPGYMATGLNTQILNDQARYESILKRIPKGRWGTPEDIKGLVIFLASDASDYICGAVIPVDGGYLAY
jgi:2-deoxy-D-gluconate 3-dehydrogenase